MWIIGNGLGVFVILLMLAALVPLFGTLSARAQTAAPIARPKPVATSALQKFVTLSGPISLAHHGSSQSLNRPLFTWKCSAFKVVATDSSGTTVASTPARNGSEPGTCAYDLRVPTTTAIALAVVPENTGKPLVKADNGSSASSEARSAPVNTIKWTPTKQKFQKYTTSETVPLTVDLQR